VSPRGGYIGGPGAAQALSRHNGLFGSLQSSLLQHSWQLFIQNAGLSEGHLHSPPWQVRPVSLQLAQPLPQCSLLSVKHVPLQFTLPLSQVHIEFWQTWVDEGQALQPPQWFLSDVVSKQPPGHAIVLPGHLHIELSQI
jgi:hypothetical protein